MGEVSSGTLTFSVVYAGAESVLDTVPMSSELTSLQQLHSFSHLGPPLTILISVVCEMGRSMHSAGPPLFPHPRVADVLPGKRVLCTVGVGEASTNRHLDTGTSLSFQTSGIKHLREGLQLSSRAWASRILSLPYREA